MPRLASGLFLLTLKSKVFTSQTSIQTIPTIYIPIIILCLFRIQYLDKSLWGFFYEFGNYALRPHGFILNKKSKKKKKSMQASKLRLQFVQVNLTHSNV